jgi:two-component system NarL family sensor kinase
VTLRLHQSDGNIVIAIRDDGRGFDETVLDDRLARGHIGLSSHRARLESVGGALSVESSEGSGTLAQVRVPVD